MSGEHLFALLCWTGIAVIGLCWWFQPLDWWRCRRRAREMRPGFPVVSQKDKV
jgi:hypothetical protein